MRKLRFRAWDNASKTYSDNVAIENDCLLKFIPCGASEDDGYVVTEEPQEDFAL